MELVGYFGDRHGYRSGDGYGSGDGDGYGNWDGSGDWYGIGDWYWSGDGYGYGSCGWYGSCDWYGSGDGDGYGYGSGDGDGSGDWYGFEEYPIVTKEGLIRIGCQVLSPADWLKKGYEIAREHHWTLDRIKKIEPIVRAYAEVLDGGE